MIIQTSSKIKTILKKLEKHSLQHSQELTEIAANRAQNHSCFRCKKAMFAVKISQFFKNKNNHSLGIDEVPSLQLIGCQSFISHPQDDPDEVGIKASSASVFICSEETDDDFEIQDTSPLEVLNIFNKFSESPRPVQNNNQYPRES